VHDECTDEMASYFRREREPKVFITMSPSARLVGIPICNQILPTIQTTWKFCYELRKIIPNSEIFGRKKVSMKKAVKQAIEREYTDIILVNEDNKVPSECLRVPF
jgi:ribosome production factor 1